MLSEFLIYLSSIALVYAPPLALLMALPIRALGVRLSGRSLGYWRTCLWVYLVEVLGHMVALIIRYPLGAYRPPVTNDPWHWLENFLGIFLASLFLARLLPPGSGGVRPETRGALRLSLVVSLFILLADAVLLLVFYKFLAANFPD